MKQKEYGSEMKTDAMPVFYWTAFPCLVPSSLSLCCPRGETGLGVVNGESWFALSLLRMKEVAKKKK